VCGATVEKKAMAQTPKRITAHTAAIEINKFSVFIVFALSGLGLLRAIYRKITPKACPHPVNGRCYRSNTG